MITFIYINKESNIDAINASISSVRKFCVIPQDEMKFVIIGKTDALIDADIIEADLKKISAKNLAALCTAQSDGLIVIMPDLCFFTKQFLIENLLVPKIDSKKGYAGMPFVVSSVNLKNIIEPKDYKPKSLDMILYDYYTKYYAEYPVEVLNFPADNILTPVVKPETKPQKIIDFIKSNDRWILTCKPECWESVSEVLKELLPDETTS